MKDRPLNVIDAHKKPIVPRETGMRVFGLALAGALALTPSIPAHADQPGPKMRPAGSAPSIAQGAGTGSGWPAMPGGGDRGLHPKPGHSSQWGENWARLHWAPNHFYGFWGPPEAWGGPYIVWGVPYVPYRNYGDWGALWYPYAEWRGPHGGWGNP
jgi:hypothetical protein